MSSRPVPRVSAGGTDSDRRPTMQTPGARIPTGNVYRVEGKRRPIWYARYRLPD